MAATIKRRKPAQLEMAGGKGSRQLAWEMLRQFGKNGITTIELVRKTKVHEDTLTTYLRSLERGGFLSVSVKRSANNRDQKVWNLVRDNGLEAPRLSRDGKPVVQGLGNEAMWRTMRMTKDFNSRELAAFASTEEVKISEATAQTYVLSLYAAGYLLMVQEAVKGRGAKQARYRLAPGKFTGPRPPMIQRSKTIYDPNLNQVVWTEPEKHHDDL